MADAAWPGRGGSEATSRFTTTVVATVRLAASALLFIPAAILATDHAPDLQQILESSRAVAARYRFKSPDTGDTTLVPVDATASASAGRTNATQLRQDGVKTAIALVQSVPEADAATLFSLGMATAGIVPGRLIDEAGGQVVSWNVMFATARIPGVNGAADESTVWTDVAVEAVLPVASTRPAGLASARVRAVVIATVRLAVEGLLFVPVPLIESNAALKAALESIVASSATTAASHRFEAGKATLVRAGQASVDAAEFAAIQGGALVRSVHKVMPAPHITTLFRLGRDVYSKRSTAKY
jgi:hypothetical protein